MTAPALLDVQELSVRFLLGSNGRNGIVSAVTGVSLQLSAGRVLALVGNWLRKSVLATAFARAAAGQCRGTRPGTTRHR